VIATAATMTRVQPIRRTAFIFGCSPSPITDTGRLAGNCDPTARREAVRSAAAALARSQLHRGSLKVRRVRWLSTTRDAGESIEDSPRRAQFTNTESVGSMSGNPPAVNAKPRFNFAITLLVNDFRLRAVISGTHCRWRRGMVRRCLDRRRMRTDDPSCSTG
jgi:hypothetical protein